MPRLRKGLLEEKAMVWRLGEGCRSVAGILACEVSGQVCMYGWMGGWVRAGVWARAWEMEREDETGGGRVCLAWPGLASAPAVPCNAMRGGLCQQGGWVLQVRTWRRASCRECHGQSMHSAQLLLGADSQFACLILLLCMSRLV